MASFVSFFRRRKDIEILSPVSVVCFFGILDILRPPDKNVCDPEVNLGRVSDLGRNAVQVSFVRIIPKTSMINDLTPFI